MLSGFQVLVYRTNIESFQHAKRVCQSLQDSGLVLRATIDLGDIDKVLRIETENPAKEDIEDLVRTLGVNIDELE